MADQKVREQNLDAEGIIRVRQQGPIFAGPAPKPFHFYKVLSPQATVMQATVSGGRLRHLAITSVTVANQDTQPHFFLVTFEDLSAGSSTELTRVLVPGGHTVHLPYPHPIVLPLVATKKWSVVAIDQKPTGALFPVTVIGYTFTTKT